MEQWRAVAGYEGRYEVSDQGRVRSLGAYPKSRAKLLKGDLGHVGHHRVTLYRGDGTRWHAGVHRLVCEAFHGPQPSPSYGALHRNGNPADNSPANLYWGTQKQNAADRRAHGNETEGERSGAAKLNDEVVREIRMLHATGALGFRKLSKRFSVARQTISCVVHRKTWTHI